MLLWGSYGNRASGFPARTRGHPMGCYLSYPYRRMSHPIDIHESRCSVGERALFHSWASGRSVTVPDFFVLFPPMLCPACIGFPEEAASATFVKSSSMREPILSSAVLGSATKSSYRRRIVLLGPSWAQTHSDARLRTVQRTPVFHIG